MNDTTETNAEILAWQPELRPALPCVYGPIDFREFRDQLIAIDQLLDKGGIEERFVRLADAEQGNHRNVTARLRFAQASGLALRCNLARKLTGLDYREFAVRCAESSLLQWFLRINKVDNIKTPSKSTLERFDKWVSAQAMTAFNQMIFAAACGEQAREDALGLSAPLDDTEIWFDSTCLKANIHFPVDWLLLRDATRTLMKATALIRRSGPKQRMPAGPEDFLRRMNNLAMGMSAANRQAGSKPTRKKILRSMKTLQGKIAAHARTHRDLLANPGAETTLSAKQAAVVVARIDAVLAQLPAAIKQAHERIIGERTVPNAEKILSLYEPDVAVQVRGKAGARVEFGQKLWLGETREGMIADYRLEKEAPADTTLVPPAIKRVLAAGVKLKRMWGDRGLFSKANEGVLENHGIKSGLCPRDPKILRTRLESDPELGAGLRRRGATEARIAIFKNCFAGSPCLAKGFAHREQAVGWAVLAHNLWVLARRENSAARKQQAA